MATTSMAAAGGQGTGTGQAREADLISSGVLA